MKEQDQDAAGVVASKQSLTRAEIFERQRNIVEQVIGAYSVCKLEVQPISAFNHDSQYRCSTPKWSPVGVEFIADVERTVRRAIAKQPDAVELAKTWWKVVGNGVSKKIGETEARLIRLVGPLFIRFGLRPGAYFVHIRHRGSHRGAAGIAEVYLETKDAA